jgi:hypothetical protein
MIIGLIGEIGVGKTEFCNFMSKYLDGNVMIHNFSDPLKQFAMSIGFRYNEVYGTQAEKLAVNPQWGISGREFMQKFGTDLCRVQLGAVIPAMNLRGNSLWVETMRHKLALASGQSLVIAGDCRFADEVKLIHDLGGVVIKITRPGGNDTIAAAHVSETGIARLPYDFLIENNSSLVDYHVEILRTWGDCSR